jgi:adenylate kinase
MKIHLILMGVQGSGKGTQAAILRDTYGLIHVSTGDLFRALFKREDEFAIKIREILNSGKLVSDEDTNNVLLDHLNRTDQKNGVIFDGYPRNIAQAEWLERHLASKGEALTAALLLDLDPYVAFKRAFGRVSSAVNKDVTYNIYYNADGIEYTFEKFEKDEFPPRLVAKVTATGEKLVRRADDANADAVLKRIDTYLETTAPLVDYYSAKGLLVKINALESIETVTAHLRAEIDKRRK